MDAYFNIKDTLFILNEIVCYIHIYTNVNDL